MTSVVSKETVSTSRILKCTRDFIQMSDFHFNRLLLRAQKCDALWETTFKPWTLLKSLISLIINESVTPANIYMKFKTK